MRSSMLTEVVIHSVLCLRIVTHGSIIVHYYMYLLLDFIRLIQTLSAYD